MLRFKPNAVLSLCDRTGNMVLPWAEAGYQCFCVDLQKPSRILHPNIFHFKLDIFKFAFKDLGRQYNIIAMFAFPPCTDLAVSGARWFESKRRANPRYRLNAMELVYRCVVIGDYFGCPYFIENPVSVISSEWRKPDFTFHPYEFGGYRGGENDGYTKKTCLWTGGGFKLPPKRPIEPTLGGKIWRCYGGKSLKTKNARSETPRGFARAVFETMGR